MNLITTNKLIADYAISTKAIKSQLTSFPRRTDKLTLLALLAIQPLKQYITNNCGLYVASLNPDVNTIEDILTGLVIEQSPPKPFQFVNSVSNALGFYLAKELKLDGPSVFIGSNDKVWQNLINLANQDFNQGMQQALLINCLNPYKEPFIIETVLLNATTDPTTYPEFLNCIQLN